MEFKNLIQNHLISDISVYEEIGLIGSDIDSYFSFEVKEGNVQDLQKLISELIDKGNNQPFSVTILKGKGSFEGKLNGKWVLKLITILADVNYYKFGNSHIVFVEKLTDDSSFEKWKKNLVSELAKLGFKNIAIVPLESRTYTDFNLKEVSSVESDFTDLLMNEEKPLIVFSRISSSKEIERIENRLKEKLGQLAENILQLVKYRNLSLQKENETKRYILYLEETVKTKTDYLDLLLKPSADTDAFSELGISKIQQIKNFYYYEYEILPLWFKRVGHVLKVIMGRRNFKSLFDNNVKKYKN